MRSLFVLLPIIALAGCVSPTPDASAVPVVAAPFDVPMDPGLIRCRSLSNPVALSAATEWTLGQARAAALAGQINGVPDAARLSTSLASYCGGNGGETVRTAAAQLGI